MEPIATAGQPHAGATPQLTIEDIRAQQNFGLAIAAGLGTAIAGAVVWAVVTVVTEYQLGLMAIAVGYLVGQAVKTAGKGVDQQFGILGAACGLLGCLLGNGLSSVYFYAQATQLPYLDALLGITPTALFQIMQVTFQPMDLLFYAIAVYEGYKFSFKYRRL